MSENYEWGTFTWIFFHTLAEKIKPEFFNSHKSLIIDIIKKLCNNLPCPDCTQHAYNLLNKSFITNIKKKEHLIEFLRQFHNIVNIKLDKPQVSKEQIIGLYSNKNVMITFIQMMNFYNSIKTSVRLMNENDSRKKLLRDIYKKLLSINHIFL